MPTYDYVCDACDHAFEEFQSITADALKQCPSCSKKKLRRLIGTGAGIIFKGGGFYETDYRSEGYKKDAKAETEASKPKDGKASKDSKDAKGSKSKQSESKPKPEKKPAKSSD